MFLNLPKRKYFNPLEYNSETTKQSDDQICIFHEKTDYYLTTQLNHLTKPIDNFINFIC